jgi:hypothetical protein
MNQEICLYWSVKHCEEVDGNFHFLIAPIGYLRTDGTVRTEQTQRQVVRRSDGEWACSCSTGSIAEGPEFIKFACGHIYRAYVYYRNMLVHSAQMKEKVKTMAAGMKQLNEPAVLPLDAKRKIRIQEE